MFGRLFIFASALILAVPSYAAVTGIVMNADGQTIAEARVTAFALESSEARRHRLLSDAPERPPLATAVTDAKGRFSLDTPKEHAVVVLQVDAAGYAPRAMRVERDDDAGAIGLTKAVVRTGRVTAGGKPVAGARVLWMGAGDVLRTTGEDGTYSVPDPTKWASRVIVFHPDYARVEETVGRGTKDQGNPDRSLNAGVTISGRVVARDGKTPVAGASLFVDGWPAGTSAEDGTFTISRLPQQWEWVEARLRELAGGRARGSELTLRLQPVSVVRGIARDLKAGQPIGGAEVSLARAMRFGPGGMLETTVTDAKGNFTIANVAPGSYRLMANRPGYGFQHAMVTVAAGEKESTTIHGIKRGRVIGSVFDENKQPVIGARVAPQSASMGSPMGGPPGVMMSGDAAVTAPDGSFRLYVSPDSDLTVTAYKKGFPLARSSTLRLTPGERKSGVLLTIPAGFLVSGRVVDGDGRPLSGVTVLSAESRGTGPSPIRFITGGPREQDDTFIQTASDGSFSLRLQEGTYDIGFRREGYAPKTLRAQQVKTRIPPLEVVMQPAVAVTGRVTRSGVGVANVRVSAFDETMQETTETAPDGSFTIPNLAPGSVMLIIFKQDEFIRQNRTVTAPAHDVHIEVPAGGRVSGRVFDKSTKQPVTTFEVGLSGRRSGGGMSIAGPPQLRSFTSDDGTFVLENMPAGSAEIVAIAPGYTMAELSNVIVEEGKETSGVEIALERGVRITGRVTDTSGAALSGVNVRIIPPRGRPSTMPSPTTMAMTDGNGEYTLEAVKAGETTLYFGRSGYVPVQKSVELKGTDAKVDAELSTGLTVTGIVVDESGTPVADAMVSAYSASAGGGGSRARTDQNGQFRVEALGPARYTFRAEKQGYSPADVRDIDISTGAPVRLELKRGGVIFGRVSGLAPEELAQTTVYASAMGSQGVSAPVDPSGNYRIEGAPIGTVRVSARSGGFAGTRSSGFKSVEVVAGAPAQVDIEFESGETVRGRVTRNGRPVSAAHITFYPREPTGQASGSADTDAQGFYEISGLQNGTYNVIVTDMSRLSRYRTNYDMRGSATFDIDMRMTTVTGRVVDASTGQPIEDAGVTVRSRDPNTPFPIGNVRTDSAGGFTMTDVAAGEYRVNAEKAGYGAAVADLDVGETPAEVTVKLSPNEGVRLRVVDARDGRALSASIRVVDAQERVVYETYMSAPAGADTQTIGLDPGVYQMNVSAGGYAPRTIRVNSPGSVTVPMTPGGTLVIRSTGREIRRARLVPSDGRPTVRAFARSLVIDPAPGVTRLNAIEPGRYVVQVLGPGETVGATSQVMITEGGTAEVEI